MSKQPRYRKERPDRYIESAQLTAQIGLFGGPAAVCGDRLWVGADRVGLPVRRRLRTRFSCTHDQGTLLALRVRSLPGAAPPRRTVASIFAAMDLRASYSTRQAAVSTSISSRTSKSRPPRHQPIYPHCHTETEAEAKTVIDPERSETLCGRVPAVARLTGVSIRFVLPWGPRVNRCDINRSRIEP